MLDKGFLGQFWKASRQSLKIVNSVVVCLSHSLNLPYCRQVYCEKLTLLGEENWLVSLDDIAVNPISEDLDTTL